MRFRVLNLFSLVLLLWGHWGCSHETIEVDSYNQTMRFGTAALNDSRAVLNNVSDMNIVGNSFGVYGTYTNTDWNSYMPLFSNEKVTYSGESWSYDMLKLWVPGMTYKFRAFYPYANQEEQDPLYNLAFSFQNGVFSYSLSNFVVNPTIDNQIDLLVSDPITRGPIKELTEPDDQREEIAFFFNHLLCNINIELYKADGVDFNIKLLTVRLVGMYNTGVCNNGVWSTAGQIDNINGFHRAYGADNGYLKTTALGSKSEALVWDGGLLLIPQTITDNMRVVIDFQIEKVDIETSITKVYNKRVVLSLPTTPAWEANKRITYTANIESDESIVFAEPKVNQWVQSQSGGMVIIK